MSKLKFLVSLRSKDSSYQQQNATAVQQVANRLGVDVQILFSGKDAIEQSEQLLKIIHSSSPALKPDGILCAPAGTTMAQVARAAVAAGIGWALLSREVEYVEELRRNNQIPVFSVRIDHKEIGRIQGRQMAALIPDGGLALCLVGPSGHPTTEERMGGLMSTKPANIQLKTLTADWTEQGASKAVTRWLPLRTRHDPPVKLVAAQNDLMAIGARQALKELSVSERATWMNLPFLGSLCCPDTGPEWIRKGMLTASVINPSTADVALEQMVKAIRTKTQPPERTVLAPAPYPEFGKLAARSGQHPVARSQAD